MSLKSYEGEKKERESVCCHVVAEIEKIAGGAVGHAEDRCLYCVLRWVIY